MKTAKLIPGLAAALALAAPAAHAQGIGEEGRVWATRFAPDKQPILVYGTPNTADARLTLSCVRKTGQVQLMFPVAARPALQKRGQGFVDKAGRPPPWPLSVTLASSTQRTTVPGAVDIDPVAGGSIVRVELATRAPVIEELGRPSPVGVEAFGEIADIPAAPKKLIRKFLKDCR